MELLLTDVTVMKDGYICVAGIDGLGRHYRPMLSRVRGGEWLKSFWYDGDGTIQVRRVVEFGDLSPSPQPPHIEDHLVANSGAIRLVSILDRASHWARLQAASDEEPLQTLCGGEHSIDHLGRVTVPQGRGCRSLACAPASELALYAKDRSRFGDTPQLRAHVRLSGTPDLLDLPVNDIRLFTANGSIDQATVELANRHMESRPLIASVGLTRSRPADENPRHWLQINALHFGAGTASVG